MAVTDRSQGTARAEAEAALIAERLREKPGALMLVLHEVQARFGFIPREAVPPIAKALNLSRAEVHGVISFYRDFRTEPGGCHTVRVCRAESCQAMSGEQLASHAVRSLGVDFGGTTDDGQFTLEPVYCLGNCACSPAVMVDGELYGKVTPEKLDVIIADWRGDRQ